MQRVWGEGPGGAGQDRCGRGCVLTPHGCILDPKYPQQVSISGLVSSQTLMLSLSMKPLVPRTNSAWVLHGTEATTGTTNSITL